MTKSRSRIVRLSAKRRVLLDRLLAESEVTAAGNSIRRLGPQEPAPLSFAERRTWLLQRFQPGAPWLNIGVALRLKGDLQLEALRKSALAVVQRHEILRACYVETAGSLRRVVGDTAAFNLNTRDFSDSGDGQTPLVEAVLHEHAVAPFDLGRGPLIRLILVKLADGDHNLSVTAHQMACDGPSIRIFLSELFVLYEHHARCTPLVLPPLSIQYADFAAWQHSPEQGAMQEKHLAYWRTVFDTPVRELRLGHHAAANSTVLPRPSTLTSTFPEARVDSLKRTAGEQGATLFMVLLAAFQALLGRHSGMQDFVIGIPTSNRPQRDVEALVGSFASILPLRANLSGDPTLHTLISRVRNTTIEAFSHSAAAYEQIAEQTRLPRLSAVMLLHEPLRAAAPGGSLSISSLPLAAGSMPYDIRLSLIEAEAALIASLEFQDSVFSAEEGQAFLSDLDRILTAIVEHPESRLSSLPAPATQNSQPSPKTTPSAPRRTGSGGHPRNRLERELTTLWEAVLGVTGAGIRDNFFAVGGNSLSALRLFVLIEQSLGARLPLSVLLEAPTVETLAEILRKGGFSRHWTCLVPIQTVGSQPPFFCVHGAGGNILFLRELAQHLERDQPLYGFQAAGLDGETPPLTSVEETARLYLKELRTIQPHGPYFLGGYCFGTYAALEMAQLLQQQGEQVAFLASFNETGAWRTVGSANDALDLHRNTLSRLSPARKLLYLRERIFYRAARAGSLALALLGRVMGPARSHSTAAVQIGVERAMHAAGMRYKPLSYEGRFALFRSETLAEPRGQTFWQQTVRGDVESYAFPGGEDVLFKEPAASLLAKQLADCLKRARLALTHTDGGG